MSLALYKLADEFEQARRELEAMELPPQVLADTLDGLAMPVEDKARNVAAFICNLDAEADAIEAHAKAAAAKAKVARKKADGLREYLRINMDRCGIHELTTHDKTLKITLHRGRDVAVVIWDEKQVPFDYFREVPSRMEPDKAAIKQAILDGYDVPGAKLEYRDRLEIK